MRGTVPQYYDVTNLQRITPACAGNRLEEKYLPQLSQDHPRVCGEQLPPHWPHPLRLGSPPRVRGTVPDGKDTPNLFGITPACAGNRSVLAGLVAP